MRVHRSRRSLLKAAAALGLTTTTPTWAQPFDGGIREAYGAASTRKASTCAGAFVQAAHAR